MQSTREAFGNVAEKAAAIAEKVNNLSREERIQRGVTAYGWSPDCRCDRCGDTGETPLSREYCGCPAGIQRKASDHEARLAAEWERRWRAAGIPRRFLGYRLETSPLNTPSDRRVIDEVRGWIAADPIATGASLLISGSVGVGKTGLAVGALYELHSRSTSHLSLMFSSTTALIDALKPGGDEDALHAAQTAAVLALDDLGTTRGTEWEKDRLFAVIDARYQAMRPTVVTTNVAVMDLAANLGDRLVSRLLEGATIVGIDGRDRRVA